MRVGFKCNHGKRGREAQELTDEWRKTMPQNNPQVTREEFDAVSDKVSELERRSEQLTADVADLDHAAAATT